MNTPQETIELVKKWLYDPESVSKEELQKAADVTAAAADDAYAADDVNAAAAYAANAAAANAANAAYAAAYAADDAKNWVKKYEKLAHKDG